MQGHVNPDITQGYVNSDITQRKQLQSSSGGIQSAVRTVARMDNHMGKNISQITALPYTNQFQIY